MKPITNDAIMAIRVLSSLSRAGLPTPQQKKVVRVERYMARILIRLAELGIDSEQDINTYLQHSADLAPEALEGSMVRCIGCSWARTSSDEAGPAKP